MAGTYYDRYVPCREKEIVLSQKDGVYNVNINQETTENQIEKQSDIKKKMSSLKRP